MPKYLKTNPEVKEHLIKTDPLLKPLIDLYGDIEIELETEYFEALISSIVGQQLSNKAAAAIWNRLKNLTPIVDAPTLLAIGDEELRSIGISYAKISYIKNLSRAVLNREILIESFDALPDDEIIRELVAVKGIGQWTAEMFLIFSLGRQDVFSVGDGGLNRAVKNIYQIENVPTKQRLFEISSNWKPYRTFASLYLWRSLNNKPDTVIP